jgi:hypothetical protein
MNIKPFTGEPLEVTRRTSERGQFEAGEEYEAEAYPDEKYEATQQLENFCRAKIGT